MSHPPSHPVSQSTDAAAVAHAVAEAPTGRQCGRCRGWFDADPLIEPGAHVDWWACASCHVKLFGPSN